jgi:branched-chain amino acid transport system ATP-binding protein
MLLSVAQRSDEWALAIYRDQGLYADHRDEIQWYLDRFDFEDPFGFANSAGEKKLLDIIRCLLLKPRFLLLDEPTAGLSDSVRDQLMELIQQKVAEDNMAVVIVGTCATMSTSWPRGAWCCKANPPISGTTKRWSNSTWGAAMFEAKGIRSGYTGITVIKDLDLSVEHEIFAVLGANGAGKTTLLATLARLIPLMAGEMRFDGTDITKSQPWETAGLGLGYVPQGRGVFADLTVMENLKIGAMIGDRPQQERIDEVVELFPAIGERKSQLAGTLSGGESRMVACGRALMQDPDMLLLDEPTAGLSPLYVDVFFEKIPEIHRTRGVSIILAEQNATKALEIADRVMVVSLGEASQVLDATEWTTEKLKEGYRI